MTVGAPSTDGAARRPAAGIHQFVPMLHVGDAVGQHTQELQAQLESQGVASRIYVELEDPETRHLTRPMAAYPADAEPGDVLVYQLATASDMAGWLAERTEPLVVNYHNLTPPELVAPWDNGLALHQLRAVAERDRLASRAVLGVAVSEFNRADLVTAGYPATAVVPPVVRLLDHGRGETSSSGSAERPRPRGARWLAVGRLAPNKALESALLALFAYRMRIDAEAEMVVAGRPALPVYAAAVRRFAAELGLAAAVRFEGRVSDDMLVDLYRSADVLVVVSEHEGFCLPVVEAMAHRLPVVAVARGALPEVLGGAGVQLPGDGALALADAVGALQSDPARRRQVIEAGAARLVELGLAEAGPRLARLLLAVRDRAPWPEEVRRAGAPVQAPTA